MSLPSWLQGSLENELKHKTSGMDQDQVTEVVKDLAKKNALSKSYTACLLSKVRQLVKSHWSPDRLTDLPSWLKGSYTKWEAEVKASEAPVCSDDIKKMINDAYVRAHPKKELSTPYLNSLLRICRTLIVEHVPTASIAPSMVPIDPVACNDIGVVEREIEDCQKKLNKLIERKTQLSGAMKRKSPERALESVSERASPNKKSKSERYVLTDHDADHVAEQSGEQSGHTHDEPIVVFGETKRQEPVAHDEDMESMGEAFANSLVGDLYFSDDETDKIPTPIDQATDVGTNGNSSADSNGAAADDDDDVMILGSDRSLDLLPTSDLDARIGTPTPPPSPSNVRDATSIAPVVIDDQVARWIEDVSNSTQAAIVSEISQANVLPDRQSRLRTRKVSFSNKKSKKSGGKVKLDGTKSILKRSGTSSGSDSSSGSGSSGSESSGDEQQSPAKVISNQTSTHTTTKQKRIRKPKTDHLTSGSSNEGRKNWFTYEGNRLRYGKGKIHYRDNCPGGKVAMNHKDKNNGENKPVQIQIVPTDQNIKSACAYCFVKPPTEKKIKLAAAISNPSAIIV